MGARQAAEFRGGIEWSALAGAELLEMGPGRQVNGDSVGMTWRLRWAAITTEMRPSKSREPSTVHNKALFFLLTDCGLGSRRLHLLLGPARQSWELKRPSHAVTDPAIGAVRKWSHVTQGVGVESYHLEERIGMDNPI